MRVVENNRFRTKIYSSNKCDESEEQYPKEWHYHVGRRFVPAVHSMLHEL